MSRIVTKTIVGGTAIASAVIGLAVARWFIAIAGVAVVVWVLIWLP